MKHFVTLFPEAENIHLIKDVGQIPYQMHRLFNYDATLVCYKNSSYSYLDDRVKGLNCIFLDDTGKTFYWENAALKFIYNNAKKIDVLNLYHLTRSTILYGVLYKWLNPKGILYVKLDMNAEKSTPDDLFQFSEHFLKQRVHQMLLNIFMKKADIISVETKHVKEKVQPFFNFYNKELLHLPNGLDHQFLNKLQEEKANKENIILTVGRIGSPVKNHSQLLDVLPGVELSGWNVYFIGPIAEGFRPKIETFFKNNPNYKKNVHFTGNITDRAKLFSWYKRSKILCLPSLSENFPFAMLEAMSMGNYVIATDAVAAINELGNNGNFAHVIPVNDGQALQQALQEVTTNNFFRKDTPAEIINYIKSQYNWDKILYKLETTIHNID